MYFIRNISQAHFKITCGSRWFYTPEGPIFNQGFKWFLLLWCKEDLPPYHRVTFGEFSVGLRWWRCYSSPRCGVRCLAPPSCAIWLPFIYFSCSHPALSSVSAVVNVAFSRGSAVVTNYRATYKNRKANWLICGLGVCLKCCFFSSAFVRSDKPKMFKGLQIKVGVTKRSDCLNPIKHIQALNDKQCHLILFTWKTDSSF